MTTVTTFRDRLQQSGAALAPDGIPLQFGDIKAEYRAALDHAVLMLRSHEGRLELAGRDRLEFIHRISTNDIAGLSVGEGRPTLFLNANGRILERATIYHRGETAQLITEPGRAAPLTSTLRQNIFFNDDARMTDLTPQTEQFALHGPSADSVIEAVVPNAVNLPPFHSIETTVSDVPVFIARNKPLVGAHWTVIAPIEHALRVWQAILAAGAPHGLRPAGSLTYNVLRIRAGRPGVGRELTPEYIPLEVGLWDEISFSKGCYTGQEIIARMESRSRVAKVMVRLALSAAITAPAELSIEGRAVGMLTSSVTSPDGEHFGIGVVKTAFAETEQSLQLGADGNTARILALAAAPPPMVSA